MVQLYLSFKGNCSEVLKFYENALEGKITSIVRYGDLPEDPANPLDSEMKKMILHSTMEIDGKTFILNDYMEEMTIGDNFSIVLSLNSEEKVLAYYEKLKEGGNITIDIGPTEFSALYTNLQDKFGINWILTV